MEESSHPVSSVDYTGRFQEFDDWFNSENACLEYITRLRWASGFEYPSCCYNAKKPYLMGREAFSCAETANGKHQ